MSPSSALLILSPVLSTTATYVNKADNDTHFPIQIESEDERVKWRGWKTHQHVHSTISKAIKFQWFRCESTSASPFIHCSFSLFIRDAFMTLLIANRIHKKPQRSREKRIVLRLNGVGCSNQTSIKKQSDEVKHIESECSGDMWCPRSDNSSAKKRSNREGILLQIPRECCSLKSLDTERP